MKYIKPSSTVSEDRKLKQKIGNVFEPADHEVEGILAHQWENCPHLQSTWEPEAELVSAQRLLGHRDGQEAQEGTVRGAKEQHEGPNIGPGEATAAMNTKVLEQFSAGREPCRGASGLVNVPVDTAASDATANQALVSQTQAGRRPSSAATVVEAAEVVCTSRLANRGQFKRVRFVFDGSPSQRTCDQNTEHAVDCSPTLPPSEPCRRRFGQRFRQPLRVPSTAVPDEVPVPKVVHLGAPLSAQSRCLKSDVVRGRRVLVCRWRESDSDALPTPFRCEPPCPCVRRSASVPASRGCPSCAPNTVAPLRPVTICGAKALFIYRTLQSPELPSGSPATGGATAASRVAISAAVSSLEPQSICQTCPCSIMPCSGLRAKNSPVEKIDVFEQVGLLVRLRDHFKSQVTCENTSGNRPAVWTACTYQGSHAGPASGG